MTGFRQTGSGFPRPESEGWLYTPPGWAGLAGGLGADFVSLAVPPGRWLIIPLLTVALGAGGTNGAGWVGTQSSAGYSPIPPTPPWAVQSVITYPPALTSNVGVPLGAFAWESAVETTLWLSGGGWSSGYFGTGSLFALENWS
jgi:hypothetical protein